MANIFSVNGWESGRTYKTHDIVTHSLNGKKKYFYSLQDHSSDGGSTPGLNSAYWAGHSYHLLTSKLKPSFIWRPSYNLVVSATPLVIRTKFGDGYEQRTIDGINSLLLEADLSFEARGSKETAAILHFFSARKAQESFLLTLPHPYDLPKLYVCRAWSSNYVFYDNYSIRAKIEEVTG